MVESEDEPTGESNPIPLDLRSTGIKNAFVALLIFHFSLAILHVVYLVVTYTPGHSPDRGGELTLFLLILITQMGWTQLFYLPAYASVLHRRGFPNQRSGVLFVCGLLFLLTSLCYGLLLIG